MKKISYYMLFFLLCLALYGQGYLSVSIIPDIEMPIPTGSDRFTTGGGVDFDIDYKLPFLPLLSVSADLGFSYLPIYTGDGCNFLCIGGGIGVNLPKMGKISGKVYVTGGYYYGIIADSNNQNGGNLFGGGGLQLNWALAPAFDIGLNVQYKHLSDGNGGALVQGISAGIGTTYRILQSRQLHIDQIININIFPVLYKYYNTSSIGSVIISNNGSAPVEDLEVSFYVAKYMDNPTVSPGLRKLGGGQKLEVELYALLAESVMDITEATIVSGKVIISYIQNNKRQTVEKSHSLRIFDRHAMTWDDDRKVSAYVTYKDPIVIEISKTLARIVNNSGKTIDNNMGVAIALHETLKSFGLTYVKDPVSPFIEFSKNKEAVDYIQFPRNTLDFKSGDCDDLSILYTSILQAVGIDTAFITIPGHIYMAFALNLSPKEAGKLLADRGDFIVHDDKVWIPLEITSLDNSFLDAWKTGATRWNEYFQKEKAVIYPMYDSWSTYEPVGYVGEETDISFPPQDKIESLYEKEKERFINRELYIHTTKIENTVMDKLKQYNKLGILYAQFGKTEQAKEYLGKALQQKEYFFSLVNLGNIYYLEEDYKKARETYMRALKLKPGNPRILLQLARVYYKTGDYKNSGDFYRTARQSNPDMADKFAYLDASAPGKTRAGAEEEVLAWMEE